MNKLDVRAFGLASGIVWSVGIFLMGILAMWNGWGIRWVDLISSFYVGYKPTLAGSLIGAIWGFFDMGIGAAVVAWLYNKLSR